MACHSELPFKSAPSPPLTITKAAHPHRLSPQLQLPSQDAASRAPVAMASRTVSSNIPLALQDFSLLPAGSHKTLSFCPSVILIPFPRPSLKPQVLPHKRCVVQVSDLMHLRLDSSSVKWERPHLFPRAVVGAAMRSRHVPGMSSLLSEWR